MSKPAGQAGSARADSLIPQAASGIRAYLDEALRLGRIDELAHGQAANSAVDYLTDWLRDPHLPRLSPGLQDALDQAIRERRWETLVNAFRQKVRFGTGGIRGMMAFDYASIKAMHEHGIHAPIIKGTNTINDVVLLLTSVGVARFGKDQTPPFSRVVVGYDSRIRGRDLAFLVCRLFLAFGYKVFVFDEPCPYPEVTYAIPHSEIKADVGIFISASHNDYRYNGYKLSCANGSQFDPNERDAMYDKYIAQATPADIRLLNLNEAPKDKLIMLGGDSPLPDELGAKHPLINMHKYHADHVKSFLLMSDLASRQEQSRDPLRIAFCAFHGSGRVAVPRLLREVGFREVRSIKGNNRLDQLNGLFPSFCSEPGKEQQPDPGDERAADIAVRAYREDYQEDTWFDILIGTDPDADRCGVVCRVPMEQQPIYANRSWTLLPADDMWALLLWYRLHQRKDARNPSSEFVVLSHTTTDAITRLARKHGIGVLKTWVGFASLAAGVRDVWEGKPLPKLHEGLESSTALLSHPYLYVHDGMDNGQRRFNIAAMEQSNGFSILGGPPPDRKSLGVEGHVRDKDGTLAALLTAEVAAWAKEQGKTLIDLIDEHINLDPAIGLFVTHYEPDPIDGEYPGIEGDRKKMAILRRANALLHQANAGDLALLGVPVTATSLYRTGKYDKIYAPTIDFAFPDEGIRLYLSQDRLDHVTIRPSGTGNSLRFHVQLHANPSKAQLVATKQSLRKRAYDLVTEIRRLLRSERPHTSRGGRDS